ncbi:hypothetical protein L1887_19920 [Cichorium endivia]|nr:hypothetical protein L1887_19920 [Cichorium endivia]
MIAKSPQTVGSDPGFTNEHPPSNPRVESHRGIYLKESSGFACLYNLSFSKNKTKNKKSKLSPLLGSTARLKLETTSASGISRTKLHTAFEFTGQPASGFQYLSVAGTGVPFL